MELLYIAAATAIALVTLALFLSHRSGDGRALRSDEEILEAARRGDLVSAIKAYRVLHGVGLKHAKERVEAMVADASTMNAGGDKSHGR